MPARLSAIVRVLNKQGINVEEPRSGSHFKACRDGKVYPIPAGNGLRTEIDDVYIKALCRTFGLDLAEFKKSL